MLNPFSDSDTVVGVPNYLFLELNGDQVYRNLGLYFTS